jgi:hypothetical protein
MDRSRLYRYLYVILILSVLAFMLFIIVWLKSESSKCVNDPLSYTAEKIDIDQREDYKFDLCSKGVCYVCTKKTGITYGGYS